MLEKCVTDKSFSPETMEWQVHGRPWTSEESAYRSKLKIGGQTKTFFGLKNKLQLTYSISQVKRQGKMF